MMASDSWMWVLGGLIAGAVLVLLFVKPATQALPQALTQAPAIAENNETWEWIDYKGNPRSITVRRKVH